MYRKPVACLNRWRLKGTLLTLTPMHIGDGGELPMTDRTDPANDLFKGFKDAGTKYASVFTSSKQAPLISGSSLKGSLRAWAVAHGVPKAEVEALFGELSSGAALTVHDGVLTDLAQWNPEDQFWHEHRGTAISSHVKIDPATRTAQEHLLFYTEYVPAGTRFSVTLTAQNLTEADRCLLLWILENAFNSVDRPARLGANLSNGWGKVQWKPEEVGVMGTPEIKAWLRETEKDPGKLWTSALRVLADSEKSDWLKPEERLVPPPAKLPVVIGLNLSFTGALLVNDPSRERRGIEDKADAIGHASIRRNGEYYLPASSVRGAFISQLRRIWHTRAGASPDDVPFKLRSAPCKGTQRQLAPFYKLTGAGGWRSPLRFFDFNLNPAFKEHHQEFVAIDRFTGAVSGKKKFNGHALMRPQFSGRIEIDTDRLDSVGVSNWIWTVLLYVLRDWIEGDGSIGFGASKGYGAFRAEVAFSGPDPASFLNDVLSRALDALEDERLNDWEADFINALAEVA